ncbi:MAG: LysR substrate-binding domain-containing protein [Burkholderiaceae bacterium]|jgi:DNA-binding transcriptional LysR family regulator|nr:LysR family transcriptional regulator [Burkholderiales bacterium]MCZ8336765.1 LysR substrate-binding domain-containing protein [Burkholderiaceae bacterium]
MKKISLPDLPADLQGIELRGLAYFRAVAQEGHFGRAAARLGLSQPPLSIQVRQLEERLGLRLLERRRTGVVPTAAGHALVRELDAFFPRYAQMLERVRAAARGEVGALRIGFVTPAEYSFLPAGLREFRQLHPGIGLVLHEMTSDAQFDALRDGELDAGFAMLPVPHRGLAWRRVLREPLLLALPASHPAARAGPGRPLRLARVADLPLLVFPRDKAPVLHDEILALFARAGLSPVIGQEAIQMPTIVSLVAAGLGMAVVPASLRNLGRTGVVYREPAGRAAHVEVGLAWRADDASPALARFVGHWGQGRG